MTSPKINNDEFIKHLRNVHFTLVIVCAALLLGVFIDRTTPVSKAQDQLFDITDGLKNWEQSFLWNYALNFVEKEGLTLFTSEDPLTIQFTEESTAFSLIFPAGAWTLRWEKDYEFDALKGFSRYSGVDSPLTLEEIFRLEKPETLSDFKTTWEYLKSKAYIYIPEKLAATGFSWDRPSNGQFNVNPVTWLENTEVSKLRLAPPARHAVIVPLYWDIKENLESELGADYSYAKYNHTISFRGEKHFELIEIPIETVKVQLNGIAAINSHLSKRWVNSNFERAFRELDTITKEYQNLTFEEIAKVLASESRRTQQLEAIGLKIPLEGIEFWGLLILISIQIYFALHMNEYRRKCKQLNMSANPDSVSIPWIGIYPWWGARIVFTSSVVILPCVTAALVVLRSAENLTISGYSGISILLSFIICMVTLSVVTGVWKAGKEEST